MASSLISGLNPYGTTPVIDITSKPVNMAIQVEQKEQAKRDALDKYLMEYDKSINPAGVRDQEGKLFLQKYNENKEFYLKNRDAILNPAKYGYDAQSRLMANYKDMLNLIDRSKQAAAYDKIAATHFASQKGLNPPEGYAEAIAASHLPVTDPNYKPLDITQFQFYKTHDPLEYSDKIKHLVTEGAPTIENVPGRRGYIYSKTISKIQPENEAKAMLIGRNNYNDRTNQGFTTFINKMFTDKSKIQNLEEKYGKRIQTPEDLAAVYTLDVAPVVQKTSDARPSAEFSSALIEGRSNQNAKPDIGATLQTYIDNIYNAAEGTPTNQINVEGNKIGGRVISLPEDVAIKYDRKIGSQKFSPDYFFMDKDKKYVYPVFVTGKTATGQQLIGKVGGKTGTKISDRIPLDKLKVDLSKAILGQKATLDYMTGEGNTSNKGGFVFPNNITKF